jgi:hypothetical protein
MTAPRVLPSITEKQFMAQVVDYAHLRGWAVYHPWLSIRSPRGWPDLAICRPPRLVLAEIKSDRGKTSPDQDRWLDLLGRCAGLEVFVWRPADWAEIERTLR